MFKIYGKGETVSDSEYWDGRTKYNLLQKFIQGKYSSYIDLIDPIKELITQNFETFDFLERYTDTEITKTGVFYESLQNECIISEDDIITVSIDGESKVYARLTPGIIAFNKNIQINKPAVDLASSQLEDFLELDEKKDEKVDIKYSYETDSFKCRIYKKPNDASPVTTYEYCDGGDWSDDSSVGYTHSAQLLSDLYNDDMWKESFITHIGNDLSKVNIEKLVEIVDDGVWYWVMDADGLIELTQDRTNKFLISQFTNTGGVISSIDNTHTLYSPAGAAQIDDNGMIFFESSEGIRLTDDSGSEVRIDANGDTSLTNGTVTILLSGGDVSISGNLNIEGTQTSIDTQSLLVSDNIIEVNKDLTGIPLAGSQSGLRVNRGDLDDYYMLFDEDSQSFMVGTLSDLQSVATREDSPNDTGIPFWNDALKQFQTNISLLWNGSKILSDIETVDGLHANDSVISDDDTTLATKNKVKTYVDDAKNSVQTNLTDHEENLGNPHSVTKAQVGLGNAPNWTGSTNVLLGVSNSTIPSQAAVKSYVDTKSGVVQTNLTTHQNDTGNPHSVTKAQVGLGNTPNWTGSTSVSLGTSNVIIPSQGAVKSYVDTKSGAVQTNLNTHAGLSNNPHSVTKSQVSLGNAPNWSGIISWGTPTDIQIPSAKLVKDSLDGKSDTSHTHDARYFTETEINTKLNLKSDTTHLHDDRYFTETEINTKLDLKSDTGHTHAWSVITGKPNIVPYNLGVKIAGNFYTGTSAPTNTNRLNYDGYFYATRVYNAVWNDLAEFMVGEGEVGQIMVKTQDGLRPCSKRGDGAVVGVYSDTYGQSLGGTEEDEDKIPIGISGRVWVWIEEPCEIGDLLITSNKTGFGSVKKDYEDGLGKVFAKVMENKEDYEPERVEVLILMA